MKKAMITLSAAACIAVTGAWAEGSYAISGDARLQYISDSEGAEAGGEANAIGAGVNVGYVSPEFGNGFTAGVGVSVATFLSEKEDGEAVAFGLARDDNGESAGFGFLRNTYLQYAGNDLLVKAGYMDLDTPLAGVDDVRTAANSFSAVLAGYTGLPNTTILAAQVLGMAGWDSAAGDMSRYESMTVAAAGDGADDAGVTAIAAIYDNGDSGVNGQLWYYMMPETQLAPGVDEGVNAAYADVGFGVSSGGLDLTFGAQYFSLAYSQDAINQDFSVFGVQAEAVVWDVSWVLAYNGVGGDGAVAHYWGGVPEYTGMEEYDLGAFSDGSRAESAVKAGFAWDAAEGVNLSAAWCGITGEEKAGYVLKGANVVDLALNVEKGPWIANVAYETFSFDTVGGLSQEDNNILRATVIYAF